MWKRALSQEDVRTVHLPMMLSVLLWCTDAWSCSSPMYNSRGWYEPISERAMVSLGDQNQRPLYLTTPPGSFFFCFRTHMQS